MNLQNLFSLQDILDKRISSEHNLEGTNLFHKKLLALLVELGEFANETRCFKFWSKKGASERSVVLEEYVDGLHFILSLGLLKEYTDITLEFNNIYVTDGTLGFLSLYKSVLDFRETPTKANYQDLFQCFINLGCFFKFSGEDIETAYLDKNKVNHQRQEQGY